jgi:hypothetical protein
MRSNWTPVFGGTTSVGSGPPTQGDRVFGAKLIVRVALLTKLLKACARSKPVIGNLCKFRPIDANKSCLRAASVSRLGRQEGTRAGGGPCRVGYWRRRAGRVWILSGSGGDGTARAGKPRIIQRIEAYASCQASSIWKLNHAIIRDGCDPIDDS